jgi:hypothetical protein
LGCVAVLFDPVIFTVTAACLRSKVRKQVYS